MFQTQASSVAQQSVCSVSFVEFRYCLPSQAKVISPFIDQLMRLIARFRRLDGSNFDIASALHEVLTNAIAYGKHSDGDNTVHVVCRCTMEGEVSITVRDDCDGLYGGSVSDPTTTENRIFTNGDRVYLTRGMYQSRFEQAYAAAHI